MLSTIGYEGASLEDFIASLMEANIDILVDVRERAQSRRKGFSKTALAAALENAGIGYLHFRELGDPKEGRDAARAGNLAEFKRIYAKIIRRKAAVEALENITKISKKSNACLLCYERDPFTCHRKIITDTIERTQGIKAKHLGVRPIESSKSPRRRMLHTGEGASAQI